MNLEKRIIEKIIDLAKDSGKTIQEMKYTADMCVENTPEAIERHENDLRVLGQLLAQTDFAIRVLANLFEEG